MTMRTELMEARYQQDKIDGKLRGLREEPAINEWDFWRLIENAYPHDRHNVRHHLLILKDGDGQFWDLTEAERTELAEILANLNGQYDRMFFNFPVLQSVPGIPHLHLVNLKPEYK